MYFHIFKGKALIDTIYLTNHSAVEVGVLIEETLNKYGYDIQILLSNIEKPKEIPLEEELYVD